MFNTIHSDLIRGHIDTIILKSLFQSDCYGYEICKEIENRSSGQYQLKQPTLYSCLKRLETQGFISAYWGEKTNGGRRKYYTLTELGRNLFIKNQTEWEYSRTVIDQLISDRKFNLEALPPIDTKETDTEPEKQDLPLSVIEPAIDSAQAEALITVDNDNNNDESASSSFYSVKSSENTNTDDKADLQKLSYIDSLVSASENVQPANNSADKDKAIFDKFESLNEQLFTSVAVEDDSSSFFAIKNSEPSVSRLKNSKPHYANESANHRYEQNKVEKENIEREYKTILNKLFRSKDEIKKEEIKEEPKIITHNVSHENYAYTEEKTTSNNPEPDFILVDENEEKYHENFSEKTKTEYENNHSNYKEYSEKTHTKENIFNNINTEDYDTNESKKKDIFRVKNHSKTLSKEYSFQFYVYSNKLRFVNFLIVGLLMILEITAMYLAFSLLKYNKTTDTPMYIFSYILAALLIIISFIIMRVNPQKKQRAQLHLLNNIIFYSMLFIMSVMLVVLINLVANMTIFNYKEYLVSIIVPGVLASNFLISSVIHYFLYKSKRFSV